MLGPDMSRSELISIVAVVVASAKFGYDVVTYLVKRRQRSEEVLDTRFRTVIDEAETQDEWARAQIELRRRECLELGDKITSQITKDLNALRERTYNDSIALERRLTTIEVSHAYLREFIKRGATDVLHDPHPDHKEKDDLLEAYKSGNISERDIPKLAARVESMIDESERTHGQRAWAVLFLWALRDEYPQLLRPPRKGHSGSLP